jgi:DNA-binding winged helix-turn-helix (wHTH) protein/tetratricopeptide (TPR) repeat protein
MSSPSQLWVRYRFGPFELDSSSGTLSRNGNRVKLQDLPCRLLVLLLERPGEIVTREELRNHLWSENTFVEFDKSVGVAIRKIRESLRDDAETPRYVETIPRRGFRFIAPVSIDGSPTAAVPGRVGTPTPTVAEEERRHSGAPPLRRAWPWLFPLALVTLAVGLGVYKLRTARLFASPKNTPPAETRVRRSVAVIGFHNLRGNPEDNWLSAAFAEMLNTELAAGGELRMVSGEDVAQAKSGLPLGNEDSLGKSTLQRLRTNPGADVVVVGSYTILQNDSKRKIRLDVRLQDTTEGDTIAEQAVSGDENDLFSLVADLGAKLRGSLGAAAVSEESEIATRAALPGNEKAARLYAEGRARSWAFDYYGARDLLEKAIVADPEFPLAHAALSEVWWHAGYDAKARAEAQRALELSSHLSQEQRLLVEGQYQRTVQEWPQAVETYRALFRLFPDNLDYGLLFASAQNHVSAADSLQTLAELRRLPSPLGDDARIDVTEASAWINRDLNKARVAAMLAIEKATAQGSPAIVSRAYGILCQQEPAIDASDEAVSDCRNAMEQGIAAKDPNGEAMMRTDLAALYYLRGNIAESAEMIQQAVKKFRQIGNRDGVATALSNFADTRLSQGELMEAKKLLEEAIPEYQAVDDKEGVALNLDSLGDIWRQSGKLDRAETSYRQAEAIARKIDDKNAVAYILTGEGDLALDRGNLGLAQKSYEEALELRSQAGEKQTAAESRISLAELAVEEGHASDAETSARACKQQFEQEKQQDDELNAGLVIVDALLAEGKQNEAEQEIEADRRRGSESQNRFLRLQFLLAWGHVLLASSRPEASRQLFHQVGSDAHSHAFIGIELANDLALAELAKDTKHSAEAEQRFRALHKAATSEGFGLIARKAIQESLIHGK